MSDIYEYCEEHYEETIALLKFITSIPAPTGAEEKRANAVLDYLAGFGIKSDIDRSGNVISILHGKRDEFVVFSAHLDTVFPDTRPIEVLDDGISLYAPGVGDDTANLVNLLMAMRYYHENKEAVPRYSILFAFVTGEEGLGNLKGTKGLYEDYAGRIKEAVSLDLYLNTFVETAIGSHRYRISVQTEGGHSLSDFGNLSAIKVIADIIEQLYGVTLPDGGLTVYNAGVVQGGTSVNSIAESAHILYEFRSDRHENLIAMEDKLRHILDLFSLEDAKVSCECIGIRPCGSDEFKHSERNRRFLEPIFEILSEEYSGEVKRTFGSTDANIPVSKGIPAVTFGTVSGGGIHTRSEWIEKKSMLTGQIVAIRVLGLYFLT